MKSRPINFLQLTLLASVFVAGVGSALADEKVFKQVCAVCHGAGGEGIPGLAPPLAGSSFVKETDVDALAAFIQEGRAGGDKKFPDYPSPMPPYNGGDSKAKSVAAYIKNL